MPERSDYQYLCGNCGLISAVRLRAPLVHDAETGELAAVTCPHCKWEHDEDDGGPGLYQGSPADMEAQRRSLLGDPERNWADVWADAWEGLGHRNEVTEKMVDRFQRAYMGASGEWLLAEDVRFALEEMLDWEKCS